MFFFFFMVKDRLGCESRNIVIEEKDRSFPIKQIKSIIKKNNKIFAF